MSLNALLNFSKCSVLHENLNNILFECDRRIMNLYLLKQMSLSCLSQEKSTLVVVVH